MPHCGRTTLRIIEGWMDSQFTPRARLRRPLQQDRHYCLQNSSRSALTLSLWVEHMP